MHVKSISNTLWIRLLFQNMALCFTCRDFVHNDQIHAVERTHCVRRDGSPLVRRPAIPEVRPGPRRRHRACRERVAARVGTRMEGGPRQRGRCRGDARQGGRVGARAGVPDPRRVSEGRRSRPSAVRGRGGAVAIGRRAGSRAAERRQLPRRTDQARARHARLPDSPQLGAWRPPGVRRRIVGRRRSGAPRVPRRAPEGLRPRPRLAVAHAAGLPRGRDRRESPRRGGTLT